MTDKQFDNGVTDLTFDFIIAGLELNGKELDALRRVRLHKENRYDVMRDLHMNQALFNRAVQKFDEEHKRLRSGKL